jgi:hypothetical protein
MEVKKMTSWELVCWLERSWNKLKVGAELDQQYKSILGAMRWQPEAAKQEALRRICENKNSSEEFIRHAERMLRITQKHQMRMELWK